MTQTPIQQLAINTIRTLSIDAINKSNSGHPGLPMGAAPMAYSLWSQHLNHNPKHSTWFNRDRFVLSAGHGSMLLYSLLHLFNYNVSIDDLKAFRQMHSKTPGHPEFGHTDGVDATTGPLGQGISNAVGMAMAEKFLSATYNRDSFNIVDHYTYALVGDGCLQEGISYEAMSMAGHMKLGKLVVLYDSNDISLDGELSLSFSENVEQRVEAMNWHYLRVEDGNDVEAISKAIAEGKANTNQPTLIEIKTTIGYGSPTLGGTNKVHGAPLGENETKATKAAYGWNFEEDFFVPADVRTHYTELANQGEAKEQAWNDLVDAYEQAHPELAVSFKEAMDGTLTIQPSDLLTFDTAKTMSTRIASEEALNFFADHVPTLFGGSADLSHSTMTTLKKDGKFAVESDSARNVFYGIREHAMGAAVNGMALHGGVKPYGATFFVFNDYLRPAIRLAALQKLDSTFVFTHDSIAVGEDGPTHEPVEHLAALRAIPGLTVIRPTDANETVSAWSYALSNKNEPVALIFSRQNLPIYEQTKGNVDALTKGAYIFEQTNETPDVILLATGSEVSLAVEAKKALENEGKSVRVVAMPSMELFKRQSKEYQEAILPSSVTKRVAIEMGISQPWHEFIGFQGNMVTIDTFGASGPGNQVMNHFGFTVENVVKKVNELN